jgi:hypothetical protein
MKDSMVITVRTLIVNESSYKMEAPWPRGESVGNGVVVGTMNVFVGKKAPVGTKVSVWLKAALAVKRDVSEKESVSVKEPDAAKGAERMTGPDTMRSLDSVPEDPTNVRDATGSLDLAMAAERIGSDVVRIGADRMNTADPRGLTDAMA